MSRLTSLDQTLRSAGIPIDGVSGSPPRVRIDFQPAATAEQQAAAQQIVESFDFRPRRLRPLNAIVQDIQQLPPDQLQKLLAAVAADVLLQQPDFARRLGIALDGDEVES